MIRHRWPFVAAVLLVAAAVPALLRSQARSAPRSFKTWGQYLGGADSSQYSALDQINRTNVSQLEAAWTYSTADTRSYRFNPLIVDGTMYKGDQPEASMAAKSIHVVPWGDHWAIEEDGQAISTHQTQAVAEKFAREEAIRTQGELVIHGRDGQIESKNSYGHDPRNIKG